MKRSVVKTFAIFLLSAFLLYYRFFPFGFPIEGKYLFFVFWISLAVLFRLSGKISVICGLFLLFISSFLLLFSHQGAALRVVVYSYYFLVIGALVEFLSLLRTKKS